MTTLQLDTKEGTILDRLRADPLNGCWFLFDKDKVTQVFILTEEMLKSGLQILEYRDIFPSTLDALLKKLKV